MDAIIKDLRDKKVSPCEAEQKFLEQNLQAPRRKEI